MADYSEDLFRYERRTLEKANKVIANDEYKDNILYDKYKSLTRKYKKLLKQSEKILKISDNNQKALRETQNNLANLLNNAGQGFLTFGADLSIDPEYSLECKRIFGHDIAGEDPLDLIFKNSELELAKQVFRDVFERDSAKTELYLTLLPQEIRINEKLVQIKYKYIAQEKVMCIITDITEKRELENKLETERHNLKMAITAIVNQGLFKKYLNDFREYFTYQVYELLGKVKEDNLLEEIYRKVHTFKGVFGQWGMNNTANNLHQLENKIDEFKEDNEVITKDKLLDFVNEIKARDYLAEDIEIVEEILGENFLKQAETIMVEKKSILRLKDKIKESFSGAEQKSLLEDIEEIIYQPLQDLIAIYEDYIYELAQRVGKKVNSFIVKGEEVLVDEDIYHDFNKSLIHIFRNMIYHGIESPNQRLINDKAEGGEITCQVTKKDGKIVIKISDDGQGIDLAKIRQRAVAEGIYTQEKVNSLRRDEVSALIFLDDLSTEEKADELAGRGVGMASVKSEVQNLGGEVAVTTEEGVGTEFEIILPDLN
ncbi:MAG: ATP-binding protein [Halanaerobacter sp.]